MSARRPRTMLRGAGAATEPRFVVVCRRQDGRERAWNSYTTQAEAEQIARHLTAIGCPARVATDDELALERGAP